MKEIFDERKKKRRTAYVHSLKLLAQRNYSEIKLRLKLQSLKYSVQEIEQALKKIKQEGFLREDLYVHSQIVKWMKQNFSKTMIKKKLEEEGLQQVTLAEIEKVFEEHHESEKKQIQRIILRKIKNSSECDVVEERTKRSIAQSLWRKGHDPYLSFKEKEMKQFLDH